MYSSLNGGASLFLVSFPHRFEELAMAGRSCLSGRCVIAVPPRRFSYHLSSGLSKTRQVDLRAHPAHGRCGNDRGFQAARRFNRRRAHGIRLLIQTADELFHLSDQSVPLSGRRLHSSRGAGVPRFGRRSDHLNRRRTNRRGRASPRYRSGCLQLVDQALVASLYVSRRGV